VSRRPLSSKAERRIVDAALPFSMTGPARLAAVVEAVRHCVGEGIEGAFAECGVWRGGSVLAMILTLQELGVSDRDLHLYDTFEGMTKPSELDVSPYDGSALESWERAEAENERPYAGLFDPQVFNEAAVRRTLAETGYPAERIHVIAGAVEQTLPEAVPERIALLRLDTDWYESTRHELEHLYPILTAGGVLIIDDYGHWEGARRAVDEYFASHPPRPQLREIDYTGRVAVRP
jgi:O-methyltransferase